MRPLVEERPIANTNEFETQLENVSKEEDNQREVVQSVGEAQDETLISPQPDSDEEQRAQEHALPRRERQAPKIFTYEAML